MRANRLPDIVPAAQSRTRKTIANWRSAIVAAENIENPRRGSLLSVYKEILDDAHLTSEIQKRELAIQASDFYIKNANDENEEELTEEFEKTWFTKFVELAFSARLYGHALIQLKDTEGVFSGVELVNRRHVKQEFGMHLVRETDDKGFLYREDAMTYAWLVEVGDNFDLGILNKCVPHVLIKRFAQSAWSEFAEIFGMPIRVGKTNTKERQQLDRLEATLKDMATAAYAVIDDEESIDFVESMKTKGEVYSDLMAFCNAEISKLINGAVIGEASQGGSRSKEEVGLEIGKLITEADLKYISGIVNETLLPKLVVIGFMSDGFKFEYEKAKDMEALWKMVTEANQHYKVPAEWVAETFGIPVEEKPDRPTFNPSASGGGSFF